MRTADLKGAALDWAVAKAEGFVDRLDLTPWEFLRYREDHGYEPSTDWAQGGPIIEREGIRVSPNMGGTWSAQIRHETSHPLVAHKVLDGWTNKAGPTPLIAAMRCYVASKLGDEIEVPEGL